MVCVCVEPGKTKKAKGLRERQTTQVKRLSASTTKERARERRSEAKTQVKKLVAIKQPMTKKDRERGECLSRLASNFFLFLIGLRWPSSSPFPGSYHHDFPPLPLVLAK